MHRLVYASTASKPIPPHELEILVDDAQDFNRKNGITGVLVFNGTQFVQVLEGDRGDINALFCNKICRDLRHEGVCLGLWTPADERMFPEWSMRYKFRAGTDIDAAELGLYVSLLREVVGG